MVVQFTIKGTNSRHTFKIVRGIYYDNAAVITKDRYNQALAYFSANKAKK